MEERRVARQPLAAVVVSVDDERVAIEAIGTQRLENAANALIRTLDDRA